MPEIPTASQEKTHICGQQQQKTRDTTTASEKKAAASFSSHYVLYTVYEYERMHFKSDLVSGFHQRSTSCSFSENVVAVVVTASLTSKQVGVAAWLECWLSHLGVAGSSPGRDNL